MFSVSIVSIAASLRWLVNLYNVAIPTEQLNSFYFNYTLNNHMWLLASVLESLMHPKHKTHSIMFRLLRINFSNSPSASVVCIFVHIHTHTHIHIYILVALSVIPGKCLLSLFIFKWYKITIDRNALQKSIHITLSFNKIYLLTFYIV